MSTKLFILLIWMVSSIAIAIFSSVQDTHKPFNDVEIRVYKRRTMLLLCIESDTILVSMLLKVTTVSYCLTLVLGCISDMLILGNIKLSK